MATKRLTPFVKHYRRAVRMQTNLMFIPDPTTADLERVNRQWELVARLHTLERECDGPGICQWCDLVPEDPPL